MATIIEFRSMGRGRGSAHVSNASCEIVLFPGVRYEYHAAPEHSSETKSKRKTSRKRDKLVLAE